MMKGAWETLDDLHLVKDALSHYRDYLNEVVEQNKREHKFDMAHAVAKQAHRAEKLHNSMEDSFWELAAALNAVTDN
jgi:hypothetical protein